MLFKSSFTANDYLNNKSYIVHAIKTHEEKKNKLHVDMYALMILQCTLQTQTFTILIKDEAVINTIRWMCFYFFLIRPKQMNALVLIGTTTLGQMLPH